MAATGVIRRLLFALLVAATMLSPYFALSAVARQDGETRVINVELILDSSGSMAEEIEPGVTRIDAAKSVLHEVIDSLPQSPGLNVGFRVYGHKGSNNEVGRQESCRSTELKVPILGVDVEALRAEVEAYQPVGWTPLALSLTASGNDFPLAATGLVNATVLVTDGLETCGGDPCAVSGQLRNGPKAITTHVIGFSLSPDEQANLQCIVDASGGMLLGAGNAAELSEALFTVLEELDVVTTTGFLEIESFGGLYPRASVVSQTEDAGSSSGGSPETFTFSDSNALEVPAGRYLVTWANPSGSESSVTVEVDAGATSVIRGSLLRLPQGGGEIYILTSLDGVVIWQDSVDMGDVVWVLPGTYRLRVAELSATSSLIMMDVQTLPGVVTEIHVTNSP